MTTATYKLTCSGNTRPVKDTLKARKWTYDPASQTWYLRLVAAHADRVRAGDSEFLKGLGGNLKGCRLCLEGGEVWRSKTFVSPAVGSGKADQYGYQRDAYNRDANGNAVFSAAIPGSDPNDRI
jgi:hypothetical protein